MLFEGNWFAMSIPWGIGLLGLFLFMFLTSRAQAGKNDLPSGKEPWDDKWWTTLIYIGLGFFVILVLLLFVYDV
jgi:hypothetical protein